MIDILGTEPNVTDVVIATSKWLLAAATWGLAFVSVSFCGELYFVYLKRQRPSAKGVLIVVALVAAWICALLFAMSATSESHHASIGLGNAAGFFTAIKRVKHNADWLKTKNGK